MRCFRARKLIDDHVSGLLPPHRNAQVRTHVETCPSCGEEAQALRAVTEAMPVFGELSPPIGAFDRILERIDSLPPDVLEPAPPAPALRILKGGARWAAASGLAAAAVLAAASSVQAVDSDADELRRGPNVAARNVVMDPRPASLKAGERAAERVTVITPDVRFRDGLLRGAPTRAAAPAIPASFTNVLGSRQR